MRRLCPTVVLLAAWTLTSAEAQQALSDLAIPRNAQGAAPSIRPQFKTIIDDEAANPPTPSEAADASQPGRARMLTGRPKKSVKIAPPPERSQMDGEPEPPLSADLAIDGHIEVIEPIVKPDGIEPFAADPRSAEDRATFVSPPAGYDALAFQIELEPTTDARTRRLARFEPYAPVGHRAGSWVLFPMLEAGVTATSNVYSATPAKPDLIFDVRPTLLAVSNWQQHAMQLKLTGLGSAYEHFPTENDRAYAFEARGRLDIGARANIEILASHSLDQEARSSTFAPTDAAKRTPYATDKVAAAFNHKINQLTVQVRGTITGVDYQPVPALNGSIIDNTDRDLLQRDATLRAAWNFNPTLAVFGETAANTQTYRAVPADGIGRDSRGLRSRVGLSFGSASQIWRGEVAVGYGSQHAIDARLQDVDGLLLDASLAWRPTQLTSVLWNAHTDFVTSTLPGQGNATLRSGSVEVRHAFQRQLNGIASVTAQQTDYQGVPLSERRTTGEVGLEYYLSRATTLLARYQHTIVTSTAPGSDATIDAVRVGVRLQP